MGSLVGSFIAQDPPLLHLKSRTSRETDRVKMKVLILLLCTMTIYTSQAKKYLVETATNGDYKMKLKHHDDDDYKMMLKHDDDGDYKMMLKHDDDGDYKMMLKHKYGGDYVSVG